MAMHIEDMMRRRRDASAYYAARSGSDEPCLETLMATLNPNAPQQTFKSHGRRGWTVFHMAASKGDRQAINKLLGYPQAADYINVQDVEGKTAIDLAVHYNYGDIAAILNQAANHA